jgi:hypothetical protein
MKHHEKKTETYTKEETLEICKEYLQGRASAQKMLLWDENGTDMWDRPKDERPLFPREFWTPSVRIKNEHNGVIGPNGKKGHYRRKDAVEQAQLFLDQCRALIDGDLQLDPPEDNTEDKA